ncbi:MAG: hypothetical protein FJX59_03140 [Alphaproteobacteria bacterium]|nr:hypothetical protein [Alphaproteobacteria bacterium]
MHLYFLGDSYVNGYGDAEFLGWAGRVCTLASERNLDITYYNLGIRGATSADVRRYWKDEVQHRVGGEKQAGIIVSLGTNDCAIENGRRRVNRPETIANVRGLLADVATRFPVIFVGPPEHLDEARLAELVATNADIKSACEKSKVPFLDMIDLGKTMINKRKDNRGLDGWHPNAAWYSEAAVLIESWPAFRAILDKLR